MKHCCIENSDDPPAILAPKLRIFVTIRGILDKVPAFFRKVHRQAHDRIDIAAGIVYKIKRIFEFPSLPLHLALC